MAVEPSADAMDQSACAAIRELLTGSGVPAAAFIDDHVANAISQRDHARAHVAELEALLRAQVNFTETLRRASNQCVAHCSHIAQNHCGDVPEEKLAAWAEAQVTYNIISVTPSPAQAAFAVERDGAAIN